MKLGLSEDELEAIDVANKSDARRRPWELAKIGKDREQTSLSDFTEGGSE